jgi:hypothetical protein
MERFTIHAEPCKLLKLAPTLAVRGPNYGKTFITKAT